MAVNPARLPNESAPIAGNLLVAQEWRDFFLTLADEADTDGLQAEYLALAERVTALESGDGSDVGLVTGYGSVRASGDLNTGNVVVTLDGDESEPAADMYYGTDSAGDRSWHPLPEVVDNTVPYFVQDGESYAVALYKQALFTIPIVLGVGSSLLIDGMLVEVD